MTQTFPSLGVAAGSNVSVTCVTEASNPGVGFVWTRDGVDISQSDNYTVTSVEIEGEFNGFHTNSTLSFVATHDHQGAEFLCKADHDGIAPQNSTLIIEGLSIVGISSRVT